MREATYRIIHRMNQWDYCWILAATLVIFGCGKSETSKGSGSDATHTTAKVAVEATHVIIGNVPEQLVVTGTTEATQQEKIVAPIAGKLLELNGLEGSSIKAGDLVARIQSKEAVSSEEGAQVMMSEARTPAERAQARRMIELAKQAQNGMTVRSQLSGLVATRSANPGEFVAENQELLSIIAESDIVFVADVPLFDMPKIHIGEPAAIALPTLGNTSAPIAARVYAIKPQADSTGQAAQVIFQFERLPGWLVNALRTGIAGTATITFDMMHNVMLVPKSAVIRNDETNVRTVVTFGPDSLAHSIEVSTGPEMDSLVSVNSDSLKPGMNVITVGNYALADSTHITLVRPGSEASGTVPAGNSDTPSSASSTKPGTSSK